MIRAAYDRAKEKLDSLGSALEQAKQDFGENSAEALKAQNAIIGRLLRSITSARNSTTRRAT